MEQDKPNNQADDSGSDLKRLKWFTYEEYKQVPTDVVHTNSEPVRPHFEKKEEESDRNEKTEVKVLLPSNALADEHVFAFSAHHLLWRCLDLLRVLGGGSFRIRVQSQVRYHFYHSASLAHHKAESHWVFNFLEMPNVEDLAGCLDDRENFLGMR